jgi:hypothetical protein
MLFKKRKIIQVFSDGCLSFYDENINITKQDSYIFQEKDFKNFKFYKKPKKTSNTVQNFYYRKKYLDI